MSNIAIVHIKLIYILEHSVKMELVTQSQYNLGETRIPTSTESRNAQWTNKNIYLNDNV